MRDHVGIVAREPLKVRSKFPQAKWQHWIREMSLIEAGPSDPYSLVRGDPPDADDPTAIFLIGPPGAGKTTWRIAYTAVHRDAVTTVLSTDDLIEDWAADRGMTYTEAFGKVDFAAMEAIMFERMNQAITERRHLLIDRTNMTARSRNRFLGRLPAFYRRHAVQFVTPLDTLLRRVEARASVGKAIPVAVITDMLSRYQAPTEDEFEMIRTVTSV